MKNHKTERYCKHCNGKCSNKPPMSPHSLPELADERYYSGVIKVENLFHKEGWDIDLVTGFKFHKHENEYYAVFNHYWSQEQGWPDRKPILICTKCEDELPEQVSNILKATFNLWNLHKLPNPVRNTHDRFTVRTT